MTSPDKLKVLAVCGRNKKRSLTAEVLFKNHPHIVVRSAGVSSAARHMVSRKDIEWADQIWCMEVKHAQKLCELFPEVTSVRILDIPDEYAFMDAELIELLTEESKNVWKNHSITRARIHRNCWTNNFFCQFCVSQKWILVG